MSSQSSLLRMPTELRHEIFQYLIPSRLHLRLSSSGHVLLLCLGPSEDVVEQDGTLDSGLVVARADGVYEGISKWGDMNDPVWARRLQNPWGPHWRCEEQSHTTQESHARLSPFLVCKAMYTDVSTLIARTVTLIINDLETIGRLGDVSATPSTPHTILPPMLQHVTQVRLVVKLPLQFYRSLEEEEQDMHTSNDVSSWRQLASHLSALPRLRKVQVWMEHLGPTSWTALNERLVLAPLVRLSERSALQISVSLPNLHPKFERETRHFTMETPGPPFTLYRRVRQRYHAKRSDSGELSVIYKADFPFSPEVLELNDRSMAQVEEEERRDWMSGEDVEESVDETLDMLGILRGGEVFNI